MSHYGEFRDRFARALDKRFYTIEYLDWLLDEGRAALWSSGHSAIVAEIRNFPSGAKAVAGVIAVGDRGEIVALIAQAEEWGRANGCRYGMIESREGWRRTMKHAGYKPFQTAIVKEL